MGLARRVFRIEEDKEWYGFSERALDYMRLSVSTYFKTLRVNSYGMITEDEDFVKVDDTWLKVAKIMIDSLRLEFQDERLIPFKAKEVQKYLGAVSEQANRKKGIYTRAGEMIC